MLAFGLLLSLTGCSSHDLTPGDLLLICRPCCQCCRPSVAVVLNQPQVALLTRFNIAPLCSADIVFYNMDEMPDTAEALLVVKAQVEAHGLRLAAVEGGPPMDLIVQGKEGRDAQIEHYKKCIRAMGQAEISILCTLATTLRPRYPLSAYEPPSSPPFPLVQFLKA